MPEIDKKKQPKSIILAEIFLLIMLAISLIYLGKLDLFVKKSSLYMALGFPLFYTFIMLGLLYGSKSAWWFARFLSFFKIVLFGLILGSVGIMSFFDKDTSQPTFSTVIVLIFVFLFITFPAIGVVISLGKKSAKDFCGVK
ncbi:MAG: hypothetical protein KAI43_09960 [Candidatus Aureabacteria bacterium]|nr:hypothetical protein [Candidatus Paceibacterota bacterium]MCK5707967.1 hypothetical protein [Candidatus Auribacterota bacterium]